VQKFKNPGDKCVVNTHYHGGEKKSKKRGPVKRCSTRNSMPKKIPHLAPEDRNNTIPQCLVRLSRSPLGELKRDVKARDVGRVERT